MQKFGIEPKFEIESIILLYARWIREGKLKVNSDWNVNNVKFTVQDPCQFVRKGFGDMAADELRFVIKKVVGEENFIDTWPNKSNTYCCGGGGGSYRQVTPKHVAITAESKTSRLLRLVRLMSSHLVITATRRFMTSPNITEQGTTLFTSGHLSPCP
jgi:Fe-S oxidoreductase